jgi:hypothetical protein
VGAGRRRRRIGTDAGDRADAATLSGFKVGDAVKFKADRVDGAIKVTELVAR